MDFFKTVGILCVFIPGIFGRPESQLSTFGRQLTPPHVDVNQQPLFQSYEPRNYNFGGGRFDLTNSVLCTPSTNSDGSIDYNCNGSGSGSKKPDLILKNRHVLWLNSGSGKDRTLNVNVPNYKIDGVIQAAQNKQQSGGKTNININLQKPEVTYVAQQDNNFKEQEEKFSVNLEYERVNDKTIHFADEGGSSQRYTPLRDIIPQPSSRLRIPE